MKWIFRKERERLRRVINLIPEYVDALVEERAGAALMADGMDGRTVHGPALRKSEKIEARIAQILGGAGRERTHRTQKGPGLSGPAQRQVFLGGLLPGGDVVWDQDGRDVVKPRGEK